MKRDWAIAALATLLVVGQGKAAEKEPSAIVEIGGSGEWGLRDGGASFGPTVAVEVEPIKNWLEIEAGVAPLFGGGRTEWGTDLLFKKPFALSDTVEFMFGAGPEWKHTIGAGGIVDSIAGEAVLDFMFWPQPERKLGWFLEPVYGYDLGRGHEQSLGVSAGLLMAIP